jgi:arginine decarboxylase
MMKGSSDITHQSGVKTMTDEPWSIEKSKVVFGLARNDLHFLDISEEGDLCVKLGSQTITLQDVINQIKTMNGHLAGYTASFTLRIPQLITYQIKKLRASFERVFEELDYGGKFKGIYPVKVNQRSDFVTTVIRSDSEYGLEAGTKSELLLIKAVTEHEKQRHIVCNGAKDPEYLKLIQECIDGGWNLGISIESLHEARLIVQYFKPATTNLILRIKPYLSVEGHWSHSTGRDSKFGLSIHDLYDVIDLFQQTGFLGSVKSILGHAGSQITDLDAFIRFGSFMTKLYQELRERGLSNLENIDFGGGLAIDYTSSSPPDFMYRYAHKIITGIKTQIEKEPGKHPEPNVMIESGRGLTALAALIIVEALEVRSVFPSPRGKHGSGIVSDEEEDYLKRIRDATRVEEIVKIWNDFHEHFSGMTLAGLDFILERETIVGILEAATRERLREMDLKSYDSDHLERKLWYPEHIVIGNFSVFNSIADHVLVQQHFPVVPIKDLHRQPQSTIRLVDITCDSDGEISNFYRQDTDRVWFSRDDRPLTMPGGKMGIGIPVGAIENIPGSYFVIPLVGAYQDAIEMDHNLLGDLPDVELALQEDNTWRVSWITGAESIEHLLQDAGYANIDIDEDPYMSD